MDDLPIAVHPHLSSALLVQAVNGTRSFYGNHQQGLLLQSALRKAPSVTGPDAERLSLLYPDTATVRERIETLRHLELSLFRQDADAGQR